MSGGDFRTVRSLRDFTGNSVIRLGRGIGTRIPVLPHLTHTTNNDTDTKSLLFFTLNTPYSIN